MSDNDIRPFKIRSAPRGSKLGWVFVSGQVPPDLERGLTVLEARLNKRRTDLVHEAVAEYVERRLDPAA